MTTDQSLRADWIAIGVGAVALALILGALGYQYLGGLPPCPMCHWQRWPHIAAAFIGLIGGGFLPRRYALYVAAAAIALVAVSGLIGAYHTGMEWKIFPGPTTCTGPRFQLGSSIDVPIVRCDVAIPVFLGQSLAFFNAVISLGVAAIAGILLKKATRAA
ncbi:MAG TPA: disulfide bond formation protein B [Rhizomicrobium sp.]|nr:disulfide bond formation protein B [Rhizomicrobium sp.]